jgi:hypothetical protein
MPKGVYLGNNVLAPNCGRFCRNVCNRLFVVGRNQCIADCLRCGGLRGSVKSTVKSKGKMAHKSKRKCHCGCGKCK